MTCTALLLLITLASPASAPASRPTTGPTIRTLTEVSAPLPDQPTERLTILVDTTEAPDLHDWAIRAAGYMIEWYPAIAAALDTPGHTPPREIRLTFRPLPRGIAFARGNQLTVGAEWVRKYPDDLGMIAHELTHVIQGNRRGAPGWLTEGIADYIRYYVVEPGSRRAKFNPSKSSYSRGYQPAAALLNWIESRAPGTIRRLQHLCREGTYSPEKFVELTGATPDEHWTAFVATLPATRPTTRAAR